MVELKVSGVVLDAATKHPMLMLRDLDDRRALLIWIGEPEAQSILLALEGFKPPRPLTHDLMAAMVGHLGGQVKRVCITAMHEQCFHAEIVLSGQEGALLRVDARPSDAIALALRLGVPVMAKQELLMAHAMAIPSEQDSQEDEAFRDFLHTVSPSDFSRFAKD